MSKVLIFYGTTEGQTRKVAERIDARARAFGDDTELVDATAVPDGFDFAAFDAIVVAASVHQGRYQSAVEHFVASHWELLQARPSALVSVSLSAAGDDPQDRADAQGYIDALVSHTGWQPKAVASVAGAFRYTEYDFFKRWVMRLIAERKGAPTDTSRDWEFTDWDALDGFVDSFLEDWQGS